MKRWSLKTRFGLAAACLSMLALLAGLLVIRPLIYRHQLQELDEQLAGNADELFRDIENFSGAPRDFRKPLAERFIPSVLRGRYIQIDGPEGQLLYRSANLRGHNLTGTGGSLKTVTIAGRDCRIGSFVHGFLTVHIGTRLGTIESMQHDLLQVTLWVAPVMGLIVFALGWWLGHRAMRPVSALTAAAEKIDTAAPEERLPLLDASQEIRRLTQVLNDSYDRLQAAYASAARFSADASHQLKTPLAVLRAALDNLRARPDLAAEVRTDLDGLTKQTRRLTTLTEDLLLLAQMDAGRLKLELSPLDLAALCRAVVDDLEVLAPARGIVIESDIPATLTGLGDSRRVPIILQNLTENAVKYAGEGGRVRLVCVEANDKVCVIVSNTGAPIPPESRDHLFDRFYRAGAGENVSGHGLGLNIARGLARAMHGDVSLVRSDGEWTEFELKLPGTPPVAGGNQSADSTSR
jgi:signal transduction histidine kinase